MRTPSFLWRVLPFSLALFGCGRHTDAPTATSSRPESPGPKAASIAIVSGNDQEAKVGEWLPKPLVVAALDAQGVPLPGVAVTWAVAAPSWFPQNRNEISRGPVVTDEHGLAWAEFFPRGFGRRTVTVTAAGARTAVTFTIDPHALIVQYGLVFGPPDFESVLCDGSDCAATVPVGAAVEWVSGWWGDIKPEWSVTSISVPPGGDSFNSGTLHENDRFRFVPRVAGKWSYIDSKYGTKGVLTAY